MLKGVLDALDHKYLNEIGFLSAITPLQKISPVTSSMKSARGFRHRLVAWAIGSPTTALLACLKEVTVWESDNCAATYSK